MTSNDLQAWLTANGLVHVTEFFAAADIGLDVIGELDENDLRELGLSMGDRKRLMRALKAPRPEAPPVDANPALPGARGPGRRQVTVMFIDLVGSTALSVRVDPEELRMLIRAFRTHAADIVRRFGGTVAEFTGDGIYVHFGYPQAVEHAAERAVHAALEVVGTLGALRPVPHVQLQARVGIVTGEVVTGDSEGGAAEPVLVGRAPNLAARIQALARPDSVLIGAGTRRLLGHVFAFRDAGAHMFKGFDHVEQVWEVERALSPANRFEAIRGAGGLSALVGRVAELSALRSQWAQALDGHCRVVAISGDPGIGKSRLVHAFTQAIAEQQPTVLAMSCLPYFENTALHPFSAALSRSAALIDEDTPRDKLHKLTALFKDHVPELSEAVQLTADLLAIPVAGLFPPLQLTPERQKQKLHTLVCTYLASLAATRGAVLVIEDLHWIDPSSLELLAELIKHSAQRPLLILATTRPDQRALPGLLPGVAVLQLGRLEAPDVAALVHGIDDRRQLSEDVVAEILRKADGVALFAEELTRSVIDTLSRGTASGQAADEDLVPASLQDSLMQRLDNLGSIKEIAQLCAVFGREFRLEQVEQVCALSRATLLVAITQLVEAQLLAQIRPEPDAVYSFRHALVQEVAYSSLLHSRRNELHLAVAKHLLEKGSADGSTANELLAYHYSHAGHWGDAITCARAAALRALGRSAHAEAIQHVRHALKWIEHIDDVRARLQHELELNAILVPGLMVRFGYASAELEVIAKRSLTLIDELGDGPMVFPILFGLNVYHHVRSNRRAARDVAERFVDAARRMNGIGQIVAGLPLLAQCVWTEGEFTAAEAIIDEGLSLYDLAAHRGLALHYGLDPLAYSCMTASQILWALGRPDAALAAAERALDHAYKIDHANTVALALLFLMMTCQLRGERARVLKIGEDARRHCDYYGISTPSSYARMIHNWARGEYVESMRIIEQHVESKALLGLTYYRYLIADTAIEAGHGHVAVQQLDAAISQAETTGERYFVANLLRLKARCLARQDVPEPAGAKACLGAALAVAIAQRSPMLMLLVSLEAARLDLPITTADGTHDVPGLAAIYKRFTEGFDTPDVAAARALLAAVTVSRAV